jgi:hypothetical protein
LQRPVAVAVAVVVDVEAEEALAAGAEDWEGWRSCFLCGGRGMGLGGS